MAARKDHTEPGPAASLQQASSVTRTLNLIGDRPRWLILFGLSVGYCRFSELLSLSGLARSLLSKRLRQLQTEGLIEPAADSRNGYRLSASGADLQSCLLAMTSWDKQWCADEGFVAHRLRHRCCQQSVAVDTICSHCSQPLRAQEMSWQNGPGEGLDPRPGPRSTRKTGTKAGTRDRCFAQVLDIVGDRWSALVIAASFFRIRSFVGYQQHIGLATNILSERLNQLCDWSILQRQGTEHRPQYRLTEKGLSLYPIIAELMHWGDRWLINDSGGPMTLSHSPCTQPLSTVQICRHCRRPIRFEDLQAAELAKI